MTENMLEILIICGYFLIGLAIAEWSVRQYKAELAPKYANALVVCIILIIAWLPMMLFHMFRRVLFNK
jgi:hypothetical protein